jgi:succinate dehydrogenase / fumarate reductase cytochrome b subunit
VNKAFQTWWYVLLYVIAMAALSFHLIHGFKSAFQTIGWNNSKLIPIIRFLGVWVFGVLIPLAFAAMPLYFFFK